MPCSRELCCQIILLLVDRNYTIVTIEKNFSLAIFFPVIKKQNDVEAFSFTYKAEVNFHFFTYLM